MEIKINLLEVASELADDMVRNPFRTAGYNEEEIGDRILEEDESGVFHYKKEYQDEFNIWYDMFYNKILEISGNNVIDKIINKLNE